MFDDRLTTKCTNTKDVKESQKFTLPTISLQKRIRTNAATQWPVKQIQ